MCSSTTRTAQLIWKCFLVMPRHQFNSNLRNTKSVKQYIPIDVNHELCWQLKWRCVRVSRKIKWCRFDVEWIWNWKVGTVNFEINYLFNIKLTTSIYIYTVYSGDHQARGPNVKRVKSLTRALKNDTKIVMASVRIWYLNVVNELICIWINNNSSIYFSSTQTLNSNRGGSSQLECAHDCWATIRRPRRLCSVKYWNIHLPFPNVREPGSTGSIERNTNLERLCVHGTLVNWHWCVCPVKPNNNNNLIVNGNCDANGLPFASPNKSTRCHSLRTQSSLRVSTKTKKSQNGGECFEPDRNSPENPFGKIIVEISSNFVFFILPWIAAGHPVIDLIIIFFSIILSFTIVCKI